MDVSKKVLDRARDGKFDDREVQLVRPDNSIQIMTLKEAFDEADEADLDLVEFKQKDANKPPIVKLMDYGKYLYKKNKDDRKHNHEQKALSEVKEVRLTLNITDNDLIIKANRTDKFLKGKQKVRLSVRLKGREKAHPENVDVLIDKFMKHVTNGVLDKSKKPFKNNGNIKSVMIIPL